MEVNRKIEENIRSIGDKFLSGSRFFAISEINSWWLSEQVDPDYRLVNALYFSGVFHVLLRRANQIFTAEASTTLNVQGLMGINPVAVKLTPPYFAYVLYANHIRQSCGKVRHARSERWIRSAFACFGWRRDVVRRRQNALRRGHQPERARLARCHD